MTTKYGRIAHDLREGIEDGEYLPGAVLPPIPELMDRYGVARDTVRDAIGLLTNEGLVLPQRGRGTVVRETDPVALHYSASAGPQTWMRQTSGSGTDEVTETGWERADQDIAERLGIPAGEDVVHRVRHFTKGHGIAQITDQWFSKTVATAVKELGHGDLADIDSRPDTSERNIFELLADAGHAPTETTEQLATRMPDPLEREIMEVPPGVPVLTTRRITHQADGASVETTTAVGAGDRMSATFTVKLNY